MTCEELIKAIHYYYIDYWNYRRICSVIGGIPPMIKRGDYYEKLFDNVVKCIGQLRRLPQLCIKHPFPFYKWKHHQGG